MIRHPNFCDNLFYGYLFYVTFWLDQKWVSERENKTSKMMKGQKQGVKKIFPLGIVGEA